MGLFLKSGDPQVYATDPAGTITNGDLVAWDTVTRKVIRQANAAAFATFLGVAEGNIPITSNIDNTTGLENTIRVVQGGVFNFLTTNAESYVHGAAVKMGADNQTVALDGGANQIIGYVNLPDGSEVTGAAGVQVPIQILSNYPSVSLGNRNRG